MMLQSVSVTPCIKPAAVPKAFFFENKVNLRRSSSSSNLCVFCTSSHHGPKAEHPFNNNNNNNKRSKIERMVKDPPLIQKTENDVSDYCSTLEGDASYSCWRGYFELQDLEREAPKEEVERLIIQAGGVKSLISCLHGISSMHKKKNELKESTHVANDEKKEIKHLHVPDGLPKTEDEVDEEEKSKMPDSPFTRLLRAKGKHPAWYTPAPDHETD